MHEFTWHAFYQSDLQALYALWIAPIAFLAYRLVASPEPRRAVAPAAAGFVATYTLVFLFETMIDPLATGPLLEAEGFRDTRATSLIPFLFVYLGDLRVLWLAIVVARPDRGFGHNLGRAAALTLVVPLWAGVGFGFVRWCWPEAHAQLLWILYEFGFLVLCIVLGRYWVRSHTIPSATERFLRALFGFSAAYYALWLSADLLIVVGGLDLGWAIRIVPNQLYYALWVPFVYWRFFSLSAASRAGEPLPPEKPAR